MFDKVIVRVDRPLALTVGGKKALLMVKLVTVRVAVFEALVFVRPCVVVTALIGMVFGYEPGVFVVT